MNILFFVSSFLLIFALFSAHVLKNSLFLETEERCSRGYVRSHIMLQNRYEKYKYKLFHQASIRRVTKGDQQEELKQAIHPTFRSHRKEKNPPHIAKFNLAPLLESQEGQPKSLAYQTAAQFLERLYGHTFFWQEAQKKDSRLSHALLDAMLTSSYSGEDVSSVAEMFPQDADLQKIFYKMLKGTKNYHLKEKQGYPPLEDFFRIDYQEKSAIFFSYAPYPLLCALFQEKVANEILSMEKKKWEKDQKLHTVTQNELETLLGTQTQALKGKAIQEYDAILNFSKKKIHLETLCYTDEDSSITAILSLPSS